VGQLATTPPSSIALRADRAHTTFACTAAEAGTADPYHQAVRKGGEVSRTAVRNTWQSSMLAIEPIKVAAD
jgi:hypothetical protein